MSITFSTCLYIIKSKFNQNVYLNWMNNFLSIVNEFNLVIYTDENSFQYFPQINNPRIMVVIRPLEDFHTYKYKDDWIKNHEQNTLLNTSICWEVNMLWSEKIFFVNQTIEKHYFDTEFYGWCDIGYFRNEIDNTHTSELQNWANSSKVQELDKTKIHYSIVNNNDNYIDFIYNLVNNKNDAGLPSEPLPPDQKSVAGGFFILHKTLMDWWAKTYDDRLDLYFKNEYLVKDDQLVLIDCIFSQPNIFCLYKENNWNFDNWFMFQRILK